MTEKDKRLYAFTFLIHELDRKNEIVSTEICETNYISRKRLKQLIKLQLSKHKRACHQVESEVTVKDNK